MVLILQFHQPIIMPLTSLHRISLRTKLLFSYLFFLLLLIVVAWVSLFFYQRQRGVSAAVGQINHLQRLFLQASRAEKHIYAYELTDTTLYATGQCRALHNHRQLMAQLRAQIHLLYRSPEAAQLELNTPLASLSTLCNRYDSVFAATIRLSQRRGFKDYGEEGRMRLYAHALETPGLPLSREALLMLRRLEKDYIIRRDTSYAFQFFTLLDSVRHNHRAHPQASKLLALYGAGFRQLVRTDAQLGLTGYTGSRGEAFRNSGQIERQLAHLLAAAENGAAAAQAGMQNTLLLVVITALIICGSLGFGFAHLITHPVNQLTRHVDAVAAHRFTSVSTPIPVLSADEVGTLTAHINHMLGQIQNYVAEEQASSELVMQQNTELQGINQRLADSESQLRQINTVKDRFFAIISHDLRGPLISMLNFMQTFEQDIDLFSPAELKLMTSRSAGSVRQMLELLDNLLAWALSHIDHIRYVAAPVRLSELVRKNGELLSATMAQKQLHLVLPPANTDDSEPAQCLLWGDGNMVDFILRNLLSNAIKFSHPGGVVRLAIRITGDWAEITVTDTGVGMSEQALAATFSSRNPTSTTGTRHEKGTGLGLITCHEFVKRHNGQLYARSRVGHGTSVTVRLPLYREDCRVPEAAAYLQPA